MVQDHGFARVGTMQVQAIMPPLIDFPVLSDPRNRNHKSLAIGNHNFEVASFSRRNRNEIAASDGVFGVAVIFLSCDWTM